MSEIFERILSEKQKEIDALKARELHNINGMISMNERIEKLVMAAFMVLDSQSPEDHFHLKTVLRDVLGYCITCECNPCECQYD